MLFLSVAVAFGMGLGLVLMVTPRVIAYAHTRNLFDLPGERKMHQHPTPRLGGVVIWLAVVLGTAAGLVAYLPHVHYTGKSGLIGLLLGSLFLLAVGLWDDLRGISPRGKLIGQIIASLIAILGGVVIPFFTLPWDGLVVLGMWSVPATLFWLVGGTNAMNLIDGLDGLASGVALIASAAMMVVAIKLGHPHTAILLSAVTGATLAFLWFNFHPARIFLGDTGSMLLGFILAGAGVVGVLKSTLVLALIIPVLILGVPIFDTLFAIGRRFRAGKPIFQADRGHLHHRLMEFGLSHRKTVLSIYVGCILLSAGALIITFLQ